MFLGALKSKTVWLALLQTLFAVVGFMMEIIDVKVMSMLLTKSAIDLGLRAVTYKSLSEK